MGHAATQPPSPSGSSAAARETPSSPAQTTPGAPRCASNHEAEPRRAAAVRLKKPARSANDRARRDHRPAECGVERSSCSRRAPCAPAARDRFAAACLHRRAPPPRSSTKLYSAGAAPRRPGAAPRAQLAPSAALAVAGKKGENRVVVLRLGPRSPRFPWGLNALELVVLLYPPTSADEFIFILATRRLGAPYFAGCYGSRSRPAAREPSARCGSTQTRQRRLWRSSCRSRLHRAARGAPAALIEGSAVRAARPSAGRSGGPGASARWRRRARRQTARAARRRSRWTAITSSARAPTAGRIAASARASCGASPPPSAPTSSPSSTVPKTRATRRCSPPPRRAARPTRRCPSTAPRRSSPRRARPGASPSTITRRAWIAVPWMDTMRTDGARLLGGSTVTPPAAAATTATIARRGTSVVTAVAYDLDGRIPVAAVVAADVDTVADNRLAIEVRVRHRSVRLPRSLGQGRVGGEGKNKDRGRLQGGRQAVGCRDRVDRQAPLPGLRLPGGPRDTHRAERHRLVRGPGEGHQGGLRRDRGGVPKDREWPKEWVSSLVVEQLSIFGGGGSGGGDVGGGGVVGSGVGGVHIGSGGVAASGGSGAGLAVAAAAASSSAAVSQNTSPRRRGSCCTRAPKTATAATRR